jgi:type II secretory pathway pseudopilin PulG
MLVELLVTLVIMGLVGAAVSGLFISQSRLFGQQNAMREARTISQSALNVILSELRMVDAHGGLEAATPTAITLRVPYALGVVCNGTASNTAVSIFPTDSGVDFSELDGYAWLQGDGTYQYRDNAALGGGGATDCTSNGINAIPGSQTALLTPGDQQAAPGAPALLYRRITYDFRASAGAPGEVALWRRVEGADTEEELSGPFDAASSGFRFYVLDNAQPVSSAPANLSQVYGLELALNGKSSRPAASGLAPYTAQFATAVFFHNR